MCELSTTRVYNDNYCLQLLAYQKKKAKKSKKKKPGAEEGDASIVSSCSSVDSDTSLTDSLSLPPTAGPSTTPLATIGDETRLEYNNSSVPSPHDDITDGTTNDNVSC